MALFDNLAIASDVLPSFNTDSLIAYPISIISCIIHNANNIFFA